MSTRPYKIVFCTPALYSAGGVERVVSYKASYFAEQLGYDVTIIVTEGNGRDCYFQLSDKVKVINFELGFEALWQASFAKKIILYLTKQRQYKKLLKRELMCIRPDFTITTLRREINFLSDIPDGSKKIGELHVDRANYRNFATNKQNPIKQVFSRWWSNSLLDHIRRLDKMVLLTDSAMYDWPELDNKIKISDPLPFLIDEKSSLLCKRIISIGRFDYEKGNDLLLQVWKKVEKQMPDWQLDIYGNGNREPYLLQMRQLEIDSSRCHLYEPINDVKKEYLNSSVFVLPSRYEGFGLVLIEAMACGVPVVSFDCENGPRSIITNGADGFLIPTFDIDAFADKLLLLMRDENLRRQMGEKAQKSAAKYDIDSIGLQWKQLFDGLMANR
jgi:glycosyltransferase involved in cell wall biosynthesis